MAAASDNVCETAQYDLTTLCSIEATVATGLEEIAKEEADEKFGVDSSILRGRIVFSIPVREIPKALELGCVDNITVLVTETKDFPFTSDELESMRHLRDLVKRVDWSLGLAAWQQIFNFHTTIATRPKVIPDVLGEPTLASRFHQKKENNEGQSQQKKKSKRRGKWRKSKPEDKISEDKQVKECKIGSELEVEDTLIGNVELDVDLKVKAKLETNDLSEEKPNAESQDIPAVKKQKTTTYNPLMPSFRVTCNRTGQNHSFDSMGAASNFGGAVNEYFGWNVSMKNFDIEVILNIEDQDVRVGIALTKGSLHRRNLVAFGRTTLRPTIAYSMLRLCKIQPGDIVCDPMCGSGSIPLQASIAWPSSLNICGEIEKKSLELTVKNMDFINADNQEKNKLPVNVEMVQWDASNLPLKTNCVDVFITDLPFGIRMGSKRDNWLLYPGALIDMARVCRSGIGRATILTQDKKCFNKALSVTAKYWKCYKMIGFNMGGLAGCLYCLRRSQEPFCKEDSATWRTEINATARQKDS